MTGDAAALTDLLRDHNDWQYALHSDFRTTTCVCGSLEIGNMLDIEAPLAEEAHRVHVAEVLAGYVTTARAGVIDELKDFLPKWDYPDRVVAAISLELKERLGLPPYRSTENTG